MGTIDVATLIETRRLSAFQTRILLLCAFVALMDGYDSVIIGLTAPAIAHTLSLDIKSFGPIFSAAQFGFMLGAFISGPLADRIGRKSILIGSVATFGLFSLLTPLSESYWHLVMLRLFTGLGLGGASTAFVSICSEYSPRHIKARVVTILWIFLPAGNVVGGLLSSTILPSRGWPLIYYVGGVIPLALVAIMFVAIPESLKFLVLKGTDSRHISAIVAKIAPDLDVSPSTRYISSEERLPTGSIFELFTDGRAQITVALWIAVFCCWFVIITVPAWTVPVLREAGIPISMASLIVSINGFGAIVGGPLIGWAMDRIDRYATVSLALLAGSVVVAVIGFTTSSYVCFALCTFFSGALLGGTSSGVMALITTLYPTAILSTGIGWAIGIARMGAVVGPTLFGFLFAAGWSIQLLFIGLGALVLIAAISIIVLKIVVQKRVSAFA